MARRGLKTETKKAIDALLAGGLSIRRAAAQLGLTKRQVEHAAKKAGLACVPARTKSDREGKLERIIDLTEDDIIEELESGRRHPLTTLNVIHGTAWDKRYGKETTPGQPVNQFLFNLFGAGGVGEKLMKIIPQGLPEPTATLKPSDPFTYIGRTATEC